MHVSGVAVGEMAKIVGEGNMLGACVIEGSVGIVESVGDIVGQGPPGIVGGKGGSCMPSNCKSS